MTEAANSSSSICQDAGDDEQFLVIEEESGTEGDAAENIEEIFIGTDNEEIADPSDVKTGRWKNYLYCNIVVTAKEKSTGQDESDSVSAVGSFDFL